MSANKFWDKKPKEDENKSEDKDEDFGDLKLTILHQRSYIKKLEQANSALETENETLTTFKEKVESITCLICKDSIDIERIFAKGLTHAKCAEKQSMPKFQTPIPIKQTENKEPKECIHPVLYWDSLAGKRFCKSCKKEIKDM